MLDIPNLLITGYHNTCFYLLQKRFFENSTAAFGNARKDRNASQDAKDHKIGALEEKPQCKNEVLAELMEDHVQLRKELGNPDRR